MSFCEEVKKSPQIAFVLFGILCLGGLLNLVGFAAPYWVAGNVASQGLWELCAQTLSGHQCISLPSQLLPGWFAAVRAMMTLGCLASFAAGGLLILFMVTAQFKKKSITILVLLACTGAMLFNVIGVAIYGGMVGSFFGWAFYLCCVGIAFFLVCSVLAGILMSRANMSRANVEG